MSKVFAVLKKMTQNDNDFVVMHGLHNAGDYKEWGDIDICTSKKTFSQFCRNLKMEIEKLGGLITSSYTHFGGGLIITGVFIESEIDAFRFDLYTEPKLLSNRSFPTLYYSFSADEFLENKLEVNGVNAPAIKQEATHYIKRKALKREYNDRSRSYVRSLMSVNDEVHQVIDDIFPTELGKKYHSFLKGENIDALDADKIFSFLKESLLDSGMVKKVGLISRMLVKGRKFFSKRKGIQIAFLAPDGAGKSTVIEALIGYNKLFGRVIYFHLRPTLIPAFGAKSRNQQGMLETDPHFSKPYCGILGLLKYWVMYMDYTIGYYIKIFPCLFGSNLVVCDRYFYDIYIDPRRLRLQESTFFQFLFRYFSPHPDICYALIAKSDTVAKRKQDLDADEIERQNIEIEKLSSRFHNIVFIDANKTADEVYMDVFSDLTRKLASRLVEKIE